MLVQSKMTVYLCIGKMHLLDSVVAFVNVVVLCREYVDHRGVVEVVDGTGIQIVHLLKNRSTRSQKSQTWVTPLIPIAQRSGDISMHNGDLVYNAP